MTLPREDTPRSARIELLPARTAALRLGGDWSLAAGLPAPDEVAGWLADLRGAERVIIDASALGRWDSALPAFLNSLRERCAAQGIPTDLAGLPQGARRLLDLAGAVPERGGAPAPPDGFLARIGRDVTDAVRQAGLSIAFIGAVTAGLAAFLAGRARYRRSDLFLAMQECGAQALPIVSVIALLVGLIFAFVGAVQLQYFGAQIFVANLVAVAMTREMGAVMTAIVLAGRTGAAYAAQLGAMEGNEEIDALRTLGIPPVEFLVVPRMIALALMMPLLCLYADVVGILGGYLVATGMLHIPSVAYIVQTENAVHLRDIILGVVKSALFGILVALAGCWFGMRAGRSAAAVGDAATRAVVIGILSIIVCDGIASVLVNIVGL